MKNYCIWHLELKILRLRKCWRPTKNYNKKFSTFKQTPQEINDDDLVNVFFFSLDTFLAWNKHIFYDIYLALVYLFTINIIIFMRVIFLFIEIGLRNFAYNFYFLDSIFLGIKKIAICKKEKKFSSQLTGSNMRKII